MNFLPRKLAILAVLMGITSLTSAATNLTVKLAWDASPDNFVEGYRLYWRPVSWDPVRGTNFTGSLDTTNLTATVSNLAGGQTYFFVVTAYATNYDGTLLESDPSNEVRTNAPPDASGTLITIVEGVSNRQGVAVPPVAFTLADSTTAITNLTVLAKSYNTNLVPDAGILFTGLSSNRTLTLNPLPAELGKSTITLTVTNGTATSSVALVLTITPPLTALALTNATVENESVEILLGASEAGPMTFQILREPFFGTLTLVSNKVTYTPTDAHFNGWDSFTYVASDNISTSAEATVTIPVAYVNEVAPYTFTNDFPVAAGVAPRAMVAADYLRDGRLDLAVANVSNATVTLLKGLSAGAFSNVWALPVGNEPIALAAADFNYDRKVDLAVLCAEDKVVQIFTNTGVLAKDANTAAKLFQLAATLPLSGSHPTALVAVDFDKNLYVDLAVLDGGDGVSAGSVEVFMREKVSAPVFNATNRYPVGRGASALAAGAVLGVPAISDKPDLVVANALDDSLTILQNTGYGIFVTATNLAVGESPMAVQVADVNGDKLLDIVVGNQQSGDVTVLTNAANLRLVNAGSFPLGVPPGFGPRAMVIGDFDKDNRPDCVVALEHTDAVAVLYGTGTNSLKGLVPVFHYYFQDPGGFQFVGARPVALVAGDFNADRLPDLAVANFASDDVSVLLNNWAPKAYSQRLTFIEDTATSIVLGGSIGPLDYILTTWPTNGTLTLPAEGLTNRTSHPVLPYRPLANRSGRDVLKYYVADGDGRTSAVASVSISILPVNDAPAVSALATNLIVVAEDMPVRRTNFIVAASPGPAGEEKQRLTYFLTPAVPGLFKGKASWPVIRGTNTVLMFTPTNNRFGDSVVSLYAKDSGGVRTKNPDLRPYGERDSSATVQFTVRVTNVNDAPYFTTPAQVGPKTTYEDRGTNWVFNVWDIDSGIDSLALTVSSTNTALLDPLNGSQLTWTKAAVPGTNFWRVTVNVNPAADQNGRTLLTFTLSDGTNTSSRTALLTVLAVNDQPDLVLATNALTVSSPNVYNTVTNRIVDLAASQARLGPANETNVQTFVLFKVLVPAADMPKLASVPTINPLTGDLIVRTRKSASTQVIPLRVYAMDSGGVSYGGVNTSAVQTVTLTITP